MSLNDPMSNMMSKILNAESVGKKEIIIKPYSQLMKTVLDILNAENYVGKYEVVEDGRGDHLLLSLLGRINRCGAIKPRFSVSLGEFEKFEKRFLLAKNFGVLVVSTSQGVMTHYKAKEKKLGGKLLAYCY